MEQGDFRPQQRTTDQIYLLRTIIKKYTTQNRRLYTCFIDFSKAFDSIWRLALIEKLSKIGINGNFLNIIRSIYSTTTNSLIYKETLTPKFTSNVGVKQGDSLSTILFNLYVNDLPHIFSFQGNHPITINNINISCLQYADDLVIMSTSHEALQKCLYNLEVYCEKWKLEVNIKKTKVIIFNKQGSLIKKHTFFYRTNKIETIKEYKYLGFIFSISGSSAAGIATLIKQAKKAWFCIQHFLFNSKHKDINTYITLFDSQVKPILLYACEAWADSIKNESDISKLINKNPIEQFQIRVLKQLLGVHKKTTNLAILVELGRHPLSLSIEYQAIKYFLRFANPTSILLNAQYEEEKQMHSNKINCFITYVTSILDQHGMSYIWRDQLNQNNAQNKNSLVKEIKLRLTDMSSQHIQDYLLNTSIKLSFLAKLKEGFQAEHYLKVKKIENRRALTKLRTSCHSLLIEAGRWKNIDRPARLCTNCNQNTIEDEMHFLFDCNMYTYERTDTFNYIKLHTKIDFYNNANRLTNLKMLFTSQHISAMNSLGKFIKCAFEIRGS